MMQRVVVEVLHNARSVQLTVLGLAEEEEEEGGGGGGGGQVRLRLSEERQLGVVEWGRGVSATSSPSSSSSSTPQRWFCLLPRSLDWQQQPQLLPGGEGAVIRLALLPRGPTESVFSSASHSLLLNRPLPRLQQINNLISCRQCLLPFIQSSPFLRVLRLPSAYWQELAELWGCHTEKFEAAPNEAIVIQPGTFYLGDNFMTAHPSHIKGVSSNQDGRLVCVKCGALVGEVGRNSSSNNGSVETRLFLHAIDNGRNLWQDRTACARLVGGLVERSQGSGDHRFETACGLRLVLSNWDSAISVEQMTEARPVAKIMYERVNGRPGPVCNDDDGNDEPADLGGWHLVDWWNDQEARLVEEELERNRAQYLLPLQGDMGGGKKASFIWL